MEPKYPHIVVICPSDDPMFIIGLVSKMLREHGLPDTIVEEYVSAATAGDVDHLMEITRQYVDLKFPDGSLEGEDYDDELGWEDEFGEEGEDLYDDEYDDFDCEE